MGSNVGPVSSCIPKYEFRSLFLMKKTMKLIKSFFVEVPVVKERAKTSKPAPVVDESKVSIVVYLIYRGGCG